MGRVGSMLAASTTSKPVAGVPPDVGTPVTGPLKAEMAGDNAWYGISADVCVCT